MQIDQPTNEVLMDPAPNVSLAELFEEASTQDAEAAQRTRERIMRMHGGLGALMYRQFGRDLEPYEISSWMWEALPLAIEAWANGAGPTRAPSTEWRYQTMIMYRTYQKAHTYMDAVRVPASYKRAKVEQKTDSIDGLESMLTDCRSIEDYYDGIYRKRPARRRHRQ